MKALLIKKKWLDLILSGEKTWELRGSNTARRGEIALIESGTGTIVGTCVVEGAEGPLSLSKLKRSKAMHGVAPKEFSDTPPYKRTHAWILGKARRLRRPVRYRHPPGAVIWVDLSSSEARRVRAAMRK